VIADAVLREALEAALGGPVLELARRPSPSRTSALLEEVDARLADGRELALLLKVLCRSALTPEARAAKPADLHDARRELDVYDRLLADAGLGTARLYASGDDPPWLLLERVAGVELYQVGSAAAWCFVAQELALLHAVLAPRADRAATLLRHDAALLRRWPERAAAFAPASARPLLERIAAAYAPVAARLLALPRGVIHGELYASNVLVDDAQRPRRMCPVDWELAGVGPHLLDVAALVSGGGWSDDDRYAIAAAYREALPRAERPHPRTFRADLDACRLHLALQWLGWAADWTPPPEHRTDWLHDATELAGRLGVA
jgi:aminoglycoside phosphotransferase (APT) family kinase protein